jgi:hypothetical protein
VGNVSAGDVLWKWHAVVAKIHLIAGGGFPGNLHHELLNHLRAADLIDWSRAAVDCSTVRAVGGGEKTGPNPTDRLKPGSKHHILMNANGMPLSDTIDGSKQR